MTWAATGAVAGIAAVGSSIYGGMQGKKAAKAAGKASAKAIMDTYKEEKRRTISTNAQTSSFTDLAIAASNLQKTGTQQLYYDDMVAEQARQLDWMKKAAKSNANAAKKGGQAAGNIAQTQGIAQGIAIAGQTASNYAAAPK
jgi:hypothetical protein